MATERINIQITETGARVVARNIDEIGNSAHRANRGVDALKQGLALLGGALAINELAKAVDEYTNLTNRIKLFTSSAEQAATVYAEIYKISQTNRQELGKTADLYARLALATKPFNQSQKDILDIVDKLQKALIISGPVTAESVGGLIQLSQAMASGRLRGDELRSILENLPKVADILVDHLNKVSGTLNKISRGDLPTLGKSGKLTTQTILDAFKAVGPELEEEFKSFTPTISQSFTVLRNAFVNFIGQMDKANGVSALLSRTLIDLAKNFDLVALAVLGLIGAAGLALLITIVTTLGSAIIGLVGILASLVSAIWAVVAAATALAAMLILNPFALALIATAVGLFLAFKPAIDEVIQGLGGFEGILNKVIGFFIAAFNTIVQTWRQLPAAFADIAIQAANYLVAGIGAGVQKVNDFLKKYGVKDFGVGQSLKDVIPNPFAGASSKIAETFKKELDDAGKVDYTGDAKKFFERLQEQFKTIANPKSIQELLLGNIKGGSNNPPRPGGDESGSLQKQLERVLRALNPVLSAQAEFARSFNVLNQALDAGLITLAQYGELVENLKIKYRDVLDPLGKVTRDLERQTELLRMRPRDAAIEGEIFQIRDQMKEKGQPFDKAAEDRVRNQLKLNQALEMQRDLLQQIKGPLEDYNAKMEQLNELLKSNVISTAEFERTSRDLRISFLDTQTDFASGFERSFLKLESRVADAAKTSEELLTTAFDKAGDAVADFALTGKFSVDSFFEDLSRQLIKMGTNQLLIGLGNLFGMGSGVQSGGFNILNALGIGGSSGIGGGIGGGLFSSIASGIGSLFGFANGGSFQVGSNNTGNLGFGIDNKLVAFRARAGETVTVTPPGQGRRGGNTIVFNVQTPDADSFRRSQGQLYARAAASLERANRRNN